MGSYVKLNKRAYAAYVLMPHKQRINREKVQAALSTLCPKCGYSIPPAEIRRVDFDTMKCPQCGERFTVRKGTT